MPGSSAEGRLRDRVAVVTGGGRGIGRAIALGLAAEGATVAVISRSAGQLDAVVAEARELGGDGLALVVDCMDGAALKQAVEEVHRQRGRLDVLFNNVGGLVGEVGKLAALEHDDELFEQNLFLNLTTAYYASRAALPHMVAGGYGRVVNIGSVYGTHGGGTIAYSAAKHGLVGLTRSLAWQLPAEVTVNCLCPGWTDTALLSWAGDDAVAAAEAKAAVQTVQGRVLAPAEIAPMAVLLASPDGAGITGQVISVDGGYKV
ncbi:MAG TPA: SDR family NAD(P)-dependent oxidoreductase [Solirubrobacterales bacterium]|nr:SDR family NAD(P)-dependent oxidoreductase [Solirubrobacterales bacterium]